MTFLRTPRSVLKFAIDNVYAFGCALIIVASSFYARNASALGAVVVLGIIAYFARRLPAVNLPVAARPKTTLAWQAMLVLAIIIADQAWLWAGSPGAPTTPVWLNSEWIDTALPQSRIFSWQTVVRQGVMVGVIAIISRMFRAKAVDLGLADIHPRWRWWGPAIILVIYGTIAFIGVAVSLGSEMRMVNFHVGAFVSAVLISFIGAGLVEECLYRLFLQTRLEVLLGRWNGIFLVGLLFGLVHARGAYQVLGGRLDGPFDEALLVQAAVTCILQQGIGGIIYGYIWSRFRNGWMMIIHHGTLDSISLTALTLLRGIQLT